MGAQSVRAAGAVATDQKSRTVSVPGACVAALLLAGAAVYLAAKYGLIPAEPVQHALAAVVPVLAGLVCAVFAVGGFRAARLALSWSYRRNILEPLHVVLARLLNLPSDTRPSRYLWVSRRPNDAELVRVKLPPTFLGEGGAKASIQGAIGAKLGLDDVSYDWQLKGRAPSVVVKRAPRPPARVLYSSPAVRELVRRAPESAPLIGLGNRQRIVAVDLDSESPHVLVSAGTGGGKSTILRTITSQLLAAGADGTILDEKRHSHRWARGLPQVTYCRDTAEVHAALVALAAEGDRRNRIVDEWRGEDDPDVGPRHVVVLEEVNTTIKRLKRYWEENKGKGDPKESPAVTALGEVLFMGRAVKMNVLLVAQYATAVALGGPEMRENFATRILARYTQNAWRMLIPEITYRKSTRHGGRAQVALGGVAHECQVVYMTEAEARALAQSSQRPKWDELRGAEPETVPAGTHVDGAGWLLLPDEQGGPDVPAGPEPVTLRQATETGILTCSLDVARKATTRDSEFPEPTDTQGTAKVYDPNALKHWEANRSKKTSVK